MPDLVLSAAERVVKSWRQEAVKRREVSRLDPVADTLDYCAGELAARLRSIAEETQFWTPEEYARLPHVNVTPQTVRIWIRGGQLSAQNGPKGYLIPKGAERTQRAG
jgi:hypothetical protein